MDGVNSAGKRVSLLNDEVPAAGARRTAALPLHRGPPTPTKPTNAASTATYPGSVGAATLPRPALDFKPPSYHSSRSSSSITTTASTSSYPSSSSSSSALHHHHHHHYHSHHHHQHSQTNITSSSSPDSDTHLSRDSRHHSSSSSSLNSPHYSPASRSVPQLLRHDSTSSSQSLSTPSPMTPTTFYEPLDQGSKSLMNADPGPYPYGTQPLNPHALLAHHAQGSAQQGSLAGPNGVAAVGNGFYPSSSQMPLGAAAAQAMYTGFPSLQQPMMADPYAMPAPAVQYQFATELIDTMAPAPGLANGSLGSAAGVNGAAATNGQAPGTEASGSGSGQQKAKKKYPCPHASRFNCTDTFTTSGHAARHGKKHTGEKNILCPTCHKAFTRKDNMKQHERTHKNRNNNNNNSVDETKSTNSRRTQSISSVTASTLTHKSSGSGSSEMDLDSPITEPTDSKRNSFQRPSLSRPAQYVGGSPASGNDVKLEQTLHAHRPELNRQFSGESQDGEGESPGLDALAMAATSELR